MGEAIGDGGLWEMAAVDGGPWLQPCATYLLQPGSHASGAFVQLGSHPAPLHRSHTEQSHVAGLSMQEGLHSFPSQNHHSAHLTAAAQLAGIKLHSTVGGRGDGIGGESEGCADRDCVGLGSM